MSDEMKKKEEEVFAQSLSDEELESVNGGGVDYWIICGETEGSESDINNCVRTQYRNIYGGVGFANCAATVEDGSWCSSNDACYSAAVGYENMKDCAKAWR